MADWIPQGWSSSQRQEHARAATPPARTEPILSGNDFFASHTVFFWNNEFPSMPDTSDLKPLGNATSRIEGINRMITVRFVVFAGIISFFISIFFNQYGWLPDEMYIYIPHHLSGKPLMNILFDLRQLEVPPSTQGRELSYLVDHINIIAMAKSVQYGFPCFILLSHIVFSILMGTLLFLFFIKGLYLDRLTSFLLVSLLWTSPNFFIHGALRSAKMGAAFFLICTLISIFYFIKKARETGSMPFLREWKLYVLVYATCLLTTLFDRQGVYLVGVVLALVVLYAFLTRSPRMASGAAPVLLALVTNVVYFFYIVPSLTYKYAGYMPDYSYNKIDFSMWRQWAGYVFKDSFSMLVDEMRFLLGGFPVVVFVILLAIFLVLLWLCGRRTGGAESEWLRRAEGHKPLIFGMLSLLAIWAMYAVMEIKHPPISWPDLRRIYYGIPTVTCVIFLFGLGLHLIRSRWPAHAGNIIRVLLVIMLAGNIVSLPSHMDVVNNGYFKVIIARSSFERDALAHIYDVNYRPPQFIWENAAYQAFRKYALEHSGAALLLQSSPPPNGDK